MLGVTAISSGGGTTTQQTSQQSSPWAPIQPYLTDVASQAQALSQSQQGNNQLPSSVAPLSSQTTNALNAGTAYGTGQGQSLINGAQGSLANLMNPQTAPGTGTLTSLSQGGNAPGTGSLQSLMQPQTAPGFSTLQNLTNGYYDPGTGYTQASAGSNSALNGAAALGGALGSAGLQGPNLSAAAVNPYLDQMFQAQSKPVIDAVNAQMGLAGRTGSGADQQLLTRNLGDLAGNVYGNNFLNEQQLGLSAYGAQNSALSNASGILSGLGENQASRLASAGSQLSGNALNQANEQSSAANNLNSQFNTNNNLNLNAASALNSQYNTNNSQTYDAATALNSQFNTNNNMMLGAAQLAPSLNNAGWQNILSQLGIGQTFDTQNNAQLQNQLQQYQYSQQQPWSLLNAYSGDVTGLGALGGQSSGTNSTTQPSQSMLPQLMGLGMSAALAPVTGGGSLLGNFL